MADITRPFFSLVVPCYNDGRYAPGTYIDRLLTNIEEQGLYKDEIEVIIADDHSKRSYQTTLKKHSKKLNIRFIETDYNCGPGNSRDKGASIAIGQWLCFADHDDCFYPGALKMVRDRIRLAGEELFVYCNFNKVSEQDPNVVVEEFKVPHLNTWVHGKFYNMDNLWKKYNVHFIRDLKTHEDIALGDLIGCILHKESTNQGLYIDSPVYMWTDNSTSVSNSNYISQNGHPFIERYFGDLVRSKTEPYFISQAKGIITRDEAVFMLVVSLCNFWINLANFRRANPGTWIKENEGYCSKVWHDMKKQLNLDATGVKVIYGTSMDSIKRVIDAEVVRRPELLPFSQWIDHLDKLDYTSMIAKLSAAQSNTSKPAKKRSKKAAVRPFFSIVIPCYNDGRYKQGTYLDRLLNSITKQELPKEDIEVVLSDDCSPVPFDDIVAPYENVLTIKRVRTDYNFAPGNTRAKGVEVATGQWLCFADHDDIYYDAALRKIKKGILDKSEQYFAFGDFYGVDNEGKVVRKFEKTMNWCHAKFYNVDNLWKPQNIHFIKDLKSHEDIAICTQVACAMQALNITSYTYFHFPVYAWTDNPQSVSHAKYTVDTETGPREFLEVFFDDYLHATGYMYIDQFKVHRIKMLFAVKGVIEIMCYCYFYTQGFQFRRPDDFYKKNFAIAGKFIRMCKKTFNLTNESIYSAVSSNNATMYYAIQKLANPGSGPYIPTQTFRQWLDLVCESYLD